MEESPDKELTLGKVVARERAARGLTLKALAAKVLRKDGRPVSMQYLHDIEHDRRTSSPALVVALARALDLQPEFVLALTGRPVDAMTEYLREHPESAAAVARLFARARAAGFQGWEGVDVGEPGATAGDPAERR